MSVVLVEERGPVSIVTINRPDKLNAISSAVALEVQAAFAAFDKSAQRVAILTGAGEKAFSGGADVNDLPELWRAVPGVGIVTEKPVICAVSGWCIGGAMVIAMMCDLLVASETARFSYPEAKLGFTGGMIAGLAARIPHKIAMEIMLLGRPLGARRAYEAGFVNEVTPPGKHLEAALAMANELAQSAPLVLRTLKRFVNDHVLPRGPSELMARAAHDLALVRESEDMAEGLRAHKEKRTPKFEGR
jgi:enoyl-CoA hydratase/carnithine racemase